MIRLYGVYHDTSVRSSELKSTYMDEKLDKLIVYLLISQKEKNQFSHG